jgi:phosphinothricin acetyltransferase
MEENMGKLKFRYALITDLESIVAIYNSTISSRMVTADTENVSVESKQKWFNDHDSSKRPLWVVENESDEIIEPISKWTCREVKIL